MNDEQTFDESNETTDQSPEVAEQSSPADSGEENPHLERPDWLPTKFETPEQLAVSYAELEKSYHTRRDDIKTEVLNELSQEHDANVPAAPGDYSMELEIDGEKMDIPETPMTSWFRDKAHSLGLAQDQFSEIMSEYIQMEQLTGPAWEQESQVLGEHAEKRLERVDAWAGANLSPEAYQVFAKIPASAEVVQLYEELMELNGQPQFNMVDSNSFQEEITEADLKSMQQDPKYWREQDPAFIAKVRAGFDRLAMRKHGTLTQSM